jgi:hypothetical protein
MLPATLNTPDEQKERLGTIPPANLVDARLELHHALQMVAGAARCYGEEQPGDAHANLGWDDRQTALVSHPFSSGEHTIQAALHFKDPRITLRSTSGETLAEMPIEGRVRTELSGWLRGQLAILGFAPARLTQERPYEMPHHPVQDGQRFLEGPLPLASEELGHWFSLAHAVLEPIAQRESGASALRCWPHHFDIATLISFPEDAGLDPEVARSIGVGLSPGDWTILQPYFYVLPWPAPEPMPLPALPLGRWQTDSWVGGLLEGQALLDAPGGTPAYSVQSFLDTAVAQCRSILARPERS